ncbi:MAG: hypothetical protein P8Y70_00125 [Candidatus Lokiarchaeota archaeon]
MAVLSDLTEATEVGVSDLLHTRTSGGIDKKLVRNNLFSNLFKGLMHLDLTEKDTTVIPEIEAGGTVDINGKLCTNSSQISITGSTSNNTWYDILLTASGETFTASFIARNTGVWSTTKQGLYSGNNRVVACVFKDSNGYFINKNTLVSINRLIPIVVDIGDWDMNNDTVISVKTGCPPTSIRSAFVIVRNDTDSVRHKINRVNTVGSDEAGLANGDIQNFEHSTILEIYNFTDSIFRTTSWDLTGYNRGWVYIVYTV